MNGGTAASTPLLRVVPESGFAPRSAAARRPIVMVLGMHRSGTSLCSHVLSAMGVDIADRLTHPSLSEPAPDNPKGHWERWEIVQLHERILKLFNRDYRSGCHDFSLPVAWWADPRVGELRRELSGFLKDRMKDAVFGFKDPRTMRLMPIWFQIANELKLAPKIVYCLRNPAQVARSLQARDGLSLEGGEYRWFAYNIDFFKYIKDMEFCTIEYETWFARPEENHARLSKFLSLSDQPDGPDLDLAVSEIVDEQLRHDDHNQSEARQPLLRSVYESARRADRDRAAREQLQIMAAQYRSFQQLQRTFEREFEQHAKSAARLPRLDEETAALRASVAEHKTNLKALQAEARQGAKNHAEALAALEQQRAQIAELRQHRAQITAALDAARSSVAERDRRVIEVEAVLSERAAIIESLQAEKDKLQEALSEATATVEALRVEAEGLRGAIDGIADMVNALDAEIERSLANSPRDRPEAPGLPEDRRQFTIARLRRNVARLIQDNRRHAASGIALESEMKALRTALSDAREIARGAIQALARPLYPVARREPPLSWRQMIRRLRGLTPHA